METEPELNNPIEIKPKRKIKLTERFNKFLNNYLLYLIILLFLPLARVCAKFVIWYKKEKTKGIGFVWFYYLVLYTLLLPIFLVAYFIAFLFSPIEEGNLHFVDDIRGWYYRLMRKYDLNFEDSFKGSYLSYLFINDTIYSNSKANYLPDNFSKHYIESFLSDYHKESVYDAEESLSDDEKIIGQIAQLRAERWIEWTHNNDGKLTIKLTEEGREKLVEYRGSYELYLAESVNSKHVDNIKDNLDIFQKVAALIFTPLGLIVAVYSLTITSNVRTNLRETKSKVDSITAVNFILKNNFDSLISEFKLIKAENIQRDKEIMKAMQKPDTLSIFYLLERKKVIKSPKSSPRRSRKLH